MHSKATTVDEQNTFTTSTNFHPKRFKLTPILTIGFLSLFLIAALVDLEHFTQSIQHLFDVSANVFGQWWQWLMILNFVFALVIALSPLGKTVMGKISKPDIGTFRWLAMIMC
ncbi:MAG: BCCT family transporter, partial [Vibrio sp.]